MIRPRCFVSPVYKISISAITWSILNSLLLVIFISSTCKVATDTYTVEVLPKILYFSTLISYRIWYTENYWLAHNFPYTGPSRSLSWLPNLWPTKLKLCLSDWTYNMMKKVDHKVTYRRETAPFKESVLTKTIRRHEQVLSKALLLTWSERNRYQTQSISLPSLTKRSISFCAG